MPDNFIVNKNFNNVRFDKWFKQQIINLPNSLIQKLVRTRKIKVNNKKIKTSLRLKEGDKVSVFNLSNLKPTNTKKKIEYKASNKERKNLDNLIIHDNEDYILINKPRGIAVQAGTKNLRNIVDSFKKTKYFKISKPFIVHRLDKETSGVFLLAKNRQSAQFFTSLFRLRKIHKTYLALVRGEVPKNLKKMDDELVYYDNKKKSILRAITHVKIIKISNKYSFLELSPQTGRKHQLRKQLFIRGFPIVGDPKYYLDKNQNNKNNIMLLHSYKLRFMKNEKKFSFKADYDNLFKSKLSLYLR